MSEHRAIWECAYDRKGFIAIGAAAFLAACGGSTEADEGAQPAPQPAGGPKKVSGELFYYNWADYVNPETYKEFTKQTGVTVKKDFYASNEDLQAKLQAGARGYDLVVPTGYMVKILAEADLLAEIDWSQLPTAQKNIDPKFTRLPYDPQDRVSIAKDWGTTGFMYRTDIVKEKPASWRDFYDLAQGAYSKKVTVLDSYPEVIGSALLMRGFSYNSEDEAELQQAKKELLALKPHVLAITSSEYKQLLVDGKAAMGIGWNGDGAFVASKKPAEYIVPEEGSEFWVDCYCVPVGAKNADAAHAWIDFAYQPRINALETSFTYYGSPLKRELLDGVLAKDVLSNPDVFPAPDTLEKLEANNVTPKGDQLRQRIWTEFKAA